MKLFLDSADLTEVKNMAELGLCDGITTNPSLMAQTGQSLRHLVQEITSLIPGPVSVEVLATEASEMLKEAEEIYKIANNIVVKLPLTPEGLKVCKVLSGRGIKTNVTLCFSSAQALLAARAGATYVSPFLGRLDDVGTSGIDLVKEIRAMYNMHRLETKILAASIRHPRHIVDSALAGADVATLPYKIFLQLYDHPLTEKGLAKFVADGKKAGLSVT